MTHYFGGNEERRLEQRLRALVARMDAADEREDRAKSLADFHEKQITETQLADCDIIPVAESRGDV